MLQWNEKDCNIKVNQISFLSKDPEKSMLEKHIKKKKSMYTYKDQKQKKNWLLLQKCMCGVSLDIDSN